MSEEKKLLIIPSPEDETEERNTFDKDLACYFASDPIEYSQCRALVRDFTNKKPCQIRQCKEKPIAEVHFVHDNGDEENIGLGAIHKGKHDRHERVLLYRTAKTVPPAFNEIEQNVFVQEVNIERVYYGLNEKYRDKLKSFTTLYRQLIELLRGRNIKLQSDLKLKTEEETRLLNQLAENERKLQEFKIIDIVHVEDGKKIEDLQKENLILTKALVQAKSELENVKIQIDACTFNIKEMSVHANDETRSLLKLMQKEEGNIEIDAATKALNEARGSYEAQRAQLELERKARVEEILNLQGLYVLVRVRCDEISGNSKLDYSVVPGAKYLKLKGGGPELTFKDASKLELWDDRMSLNPSECSKNDVLSNAFAANNSQISKYQQLLDSRNEDNKEIPLSIGGNEIRYTYTQINQHFANWIQKSKALIEDHQEKVRYKIFRSLEESQKSLQDDLNTIEFTELAPWDLYHKQRYITFANYIDISIAQLPKNLKLTDREKRKMTEDEIKKEHEKRRKAENTKRKAENAAEALVYKVAFTFIEDKTRDQIKNYQFILSSGLEYINNSSLNFISKQNENELLRNITILNVGASGSGKTTTSKALLKHIFYHYTSDKKFADFVNGTSKITLSFFEVYLRQSKKTGKQIMLSELGASVPNSNVANYLYPYLVPSSNRHNIDTKSKNAQHSLCGAERKKTDIKAAQHEPCNKGGVGLEAFNLMHRLLEYDETSETNREIKYTQANPTGSSRGVKIITLKFENSEGKSATVNLIDTPGFEPDEKLDLEVTDPYMLKISLAESEDAKYKDYVKAAGGKTKERDRLALEIQAEAEFIKNTLQYLKEITIRYRDLQLQKRNDPNTVTKEYYDAELLQIRQKDPGDSKFATAWATHGLDLFPFDSTVVVVGAFKANVESDNQIYAAKQTIDFLKDVMPEDNAGKRQKAPVEPSTLRMRPVIEEEEPKRKVSKGKNKE